MDEHPLTQPSPPRGRGLIGSSPLPMGEGRVRALFVFLKKEPPTPASPVLPPEGEGFGVVDLPPLGEVARRAVGGLVSYPMFPAKAGTQTLSLRRRGARINTPHSQPSPRQGGKGLDAKASAYAALNPTIIFRPFSSCPRVRTEPSGSSAIMASTISGLSVMAATLAPSAVRATTTARGARPL